MEDSDWKEPVVGGVEACGADGGDRNRDGTDTEKGGRER